MFTRTFLKDRKIQILIAINFALTVAIFIVVIMIRQNNQGASLYSNPLLLTYQYIASTPEGVKINLDCTEWYCSKFSNNSELIEVEDSPSYVYLKDYSDELEPNQIIFYAEDYMIGDQFCDIVTDRMLELSLFWKWRVSCDDLLFISEE